MVQTSLTIRGNAVTRIYRELTSRQLTLTRFGVVMTALAVPSALLGFVDQREVLGVSTWIKPTKFFLSIAIYALTLAWAFAFLTPERRTGRAARYIVITTIAAASLEQVIITVRAALGQRSHFNTATTLDSIWYNVMAVGAVLLISTSLVMGVMVWRSKALTGARLIGWSAGLFIAGLFGGVTGNVLGASQTGHLVGSTADDRAGMPLLGWSTNAGDLRIAHFVALHSMFILPLVGWLAHHQWGGRKAASNITGIASVLWGILVIGTMINALAGRPL